MQSFRIVEIAANRLGLKKINYKGELSATKTVVTMEELPLYEHDPRGDVEVAHIKDVRSATVLKDLSFTAAAQLAMVQTGAEFPQPKVIVLTKPKKSVFAGQSFNANEFMLVPYTTKFSCAPTEDIKKSMVVCGGDHPPGKKIVVSPGAGEVTSPAWSMRSTDDPEEANLAWRHHKTIVEVGKKKITVGFPILANKAAVKEGTELLLLIGDPNDKGETVSKK